MNLRSKNIWLLSSAVCTAAVGLATCLIGCPAPQIVFCGFVFILLVSGLLYLRTPFCGSACSMVVPLMSTLATIGVVINLNYYTLGGILPWPILENTDHNLNWTSAVALLSGDTVPLHSARYPELVAVLCMIFGQNLAVPLMFNVLCYSLSLVMMGKVAFAATDNVRVAQVTLLIASTMFYLMSQSTTLIKDVPLTLLVATAAYLMFVWRKKATTPALFGLALCLVFITFGRLNLLPLMMIGLVLIGMLGNNNANQKHMLGVILLCAIVWIVAWRSGQIAAHVSEVTDSFTLYETKAAAWETISGGMAGHSYGFRLLILPASVLLQFLLPFPWHYMEYFHFGPATIVARIGYTWYLAGALILWWIFACKNKSPSLLNRLTVWGIIVTIATAFITGGRVSRYCLPYLPLLLPASAWVLVTQWRNKRLWVWTGVFCLLMTTGLIVCHHLQSTMS